MLRLVIRDPLTHLFLLGILIYGLQYSTVENLSTESEAEVLPLEEVNNYLHIKQEEKVIPLTKNQERELIEAYINKTLLYKEATRLGLEHDALIKDRMAKMTRFYLEGAYVPPDVSEEDLEAYFQLSQDRYQRPPVISFEQRRIYSRDIDKAKEWVNANLDETELLKNLKRITKPSPLSSQFENANYAGVQRIFGDRFTTYLRKQPINRWSGIVTTHYGSHIVKIIEKRPTRALTFDEAKEQVINDLQKDLKAEWMEGQLEQLRNFYGIKLEDYLSDE